MCADISGWQTKATHRTIWWGRGTERGTRASRFANKYTLTNTATQVTNHHTHIRTTDSHHGSWNLNGILSNRHRHNTLFLHPRDELPWPQFRVHHKIRRGQKQGGIAAIASSTHTHTHAQRGRRANSNRSSCCCCATRAGHNRGG